MTNDAHITVRAIRPFAAAFDAIGQDARHLLRACGLDDNLLDADDGLVSHQAMMRMWEQARVWTGDQQIGIHLAEAAPLKSFGLHAHAMLASRDLREAFGRACRYQRLIHETTSLTLHEGADEAVLEHGLPGGKPVPRQSAEFLATLWFRFGRLIAGRQWAPRLLCFAHDSPEDVSEHRRVFNCPIVFTSGRTAVHIPNAVLGSLNNRADSALAEVLDQYAGLLIEQLPETRTLCGKLRTWMLDRLASGEPTAAQAASDLAMSVRSMHRGLRDEGTSFRGLLGQLRRQQATRLLADPRISVAEVAYLLGFAELSSFYRAFRRWTGRTPAAFRAAAATGDPPY
jgi:AraC-like DNA-binding protein